MARITDAFFVAMTGCSLDATTRGYILEEADRKVLNFITSKGLSITEDAGASACLLYAKAILADRNRFDGTFDVSTMSYSHKGGTEGIINQLMQEAESILISSSSNNTIISRVDA